MVEVEVIALVSCAMISYSLVKNAVHCQSLMGQKYFLHPLVWSLLSLLMLFSFVILQMSVEKIVVLGKVADNFDWLRSTNYLSSFVRPGIQSQFHLPSDIHAQSQRDEIICFVMSSPHHRLARSAIRRTWGKVMKPLFLIGLSDNNTMSFVMSEAKTFNDVIVEDFVDSYMNLTLKTAFALKHFMMHFKNSKYFFKIDDDVLLNVENLYKYLRDEDVPSDAIIGGMGASVHPHRDRESKWYIPYWLYGNDSFPQYIDGPAYLIPGHMVEKLYLTSLKLPFFTLEDVFFTGYIGGKTLKYNLHSHKVFRTKSLPYHHPCLHERFITVHSTSPTEMLELWNRMRREYSCSYIDKFMAFMVYKYNLHL